MSKYAISDVGRILWQFGVFDTKEQALDIIESLSYFGDLLEVVEINRQSKQINNRL